MERRILGLETEYGVTFTHHGQQRLSPDEVARYLFRRVVSWGRSSNVFLRNGARLYLDVGSHPEYATGECDSVPQLIAHDKAGERVLEGLATEAQDRLRDDGIEGELYLFKNNTDTAGNSYGCHENYLVARSADFGAINEKFIPFLISRQVVAGSGKVLQTPRGAVYCLSQRAEHIWDATSSATTRSRPIINTRDEPHADAEHYRRLHVIVGDSSMSESSTLLKVGASDLVLQMLESGVVMRDMSLDSPIRAIRDISQDVTCRRTVRLATGRELTAVQIQAEYLAAARDYAVRRGLDQHPVHGRVLDLWERALRAIESDQLDLVASELDWVIKLRLIRRYQERHGLSLDAPRIAQLDLAYHDISPTRGLHNLLRERGQIRRIVDDDDIAAAQVLPPQTTRAKLRGDFIARAQERHRDYTVDWTHLKINDMAQRTVVCKDPFASVDDRVDRLLATI